MTSRVLELAVKRGRLQERIDMQRQALSRHVVPLENALAVGDAAIEGVDWLKHHPAVVAAAAAAIVIAKPRRAWRWARRSLIVWRGWRALRTAVSHIG